MAAKDFLSFEQVVTDYPFSAGTLRRLLFDRYQNGLSKAVLQRDRKLIFKRKKFEKWIDTYFSNKIDRKERPQITELSTSDLK